MLKIKRHLTRKEWKLLITSIIIVIFVLTDAGFRQVFLKFSRLKEEIRLTEARLVGLNRILRQKEEIESGYQKAITGLRQINAPDDFLQEIEVFARKAGLNIKNIKPIATKEEDLYKIYSVKIEAEDNIPALAKFLYTFTEDLKVVGVENLQIKAQSKKELPNVYLLLSAVAFKEVLNPHQPFAFNEGRVAEGSEWKEEGIFKERHLFNPLWEKKPQQEKEAFELLGLISIGEKNAAMLRDTKENKDYYCLGGETIGDFMVRQILKDRVILESEGRTLEIRR